MDRQIAAYKTTFQVVTEASYFNQPESLFEAEDLWKVSLKIHVLL